MPDSDTCIAAYEIWEEGYCCEILDRSEPLQFVEDSPAPEMRPDTPIQNRRDSAADVKSAQFTDAELEIFRTFNISQSDPPSQLSPYHKLLHRCNISKRPKSLPELAISTCQAIFSLILRRAILSSGTNLLITDPAVVDLLLICISSVEYNKRLARLTLLPGCPVSCFKVKKVINELPKLSTINIGWTTASRTISTVSHTSTSTTKSASTTTTSETSLSLAKSFLATLPYAQQRFLAWLLSSPFSALSSIHPTSHPNLVFPSITNLGIQVFVVTRQPANKEDLFQQHVCRHAPVPVFHGTHPSRLPSILTHGLKNMSGTRYQSNGKAMGKGIYLAKEADTSLSYCYGAEAWMGSVYQGSNVRVLLGCELAGEDVHKYTHVIQDEEKVVVRFVFLLERCDMKEMGRGIVDDLAKVLRVLREMRGS